MTHRPLLWLSALGATLGAVAAVPSAAGAQSLIWTVTVESADLATSHIVEVAGDAEVFGGLTPLSAETATITIEPRVALPEACTVEPKTVPVDGGRYDADIEVACNGPYRIEVVASSPGGARSGDPAVKDIGVGARPAAPAPPVGQGTAAGVHVTWAPSPHPDAIRWVLHTAGGDLTFPIGQTATDLGPDQRLSSLSLSVVHWGVEGPTGTAVEVSDRSNSVRSVAYDDPNDGPDPVDPPDDTTPPTTPNGGGGTVPGGGGADPPSTSGPSRGTGSPQPLPEGFSEELPFGTRPESFVPGSTPSTDAPDDTERASGEPAPTGFVRTTRKTSPGLVAPFALALMMLTVAAHIAWYLRRSRPGGGGQVRPA